VGVVNKMTVEGTARSLGIKEESVRKRVRRGKMHSEQGTDGRLYVYVVGTEAVRDRNRDERENLYGDRSEEDPTDAALEMLEAKDETIRILQDQLKEEREARERADTIIAQLAQLNATLTTRVPQLEDPLTESPNTEGMTVESAEGIAMTLERSPWWRRR
jgi:hypothetical protein